MVKLWILRSVDGLFIRSLMLAFFFKVLPDLVTAGKIYIAEPPLYRVEDKKNPFVINNADYLNRYVDLASKEYKLGYRKDSKSVDTDWLDKKTYTDFLNDTKNYVEGIRALVDHHKVNDRLLEIVLEELIIDGFDEKLSESENIAKIDIQHLMTRIGKEFKEIYYDDNDKVIRGVIDSKWQELEIPESLVRKSIPLLKIMEQWKAPINGCIVVRNIKNGNEQDVSLLSALKILQKFKPNILHRFKGLGENDVEDMQETILDPNTRSLIKVNISDYDNDMQVFQMLRGSGSLDLALRRSELQRFPVTPEMIDT